MHRGRGVSFLAAVAASSALALAPAASAASFPIRAPTFGTFRSVLAQGEGQSVNAADLAAYEASGQPPNTFVSQQPLYVGIMPHASTLRPPDLNRYYKNTNFGFMPGGVGSVKSPPGRPDAQIVRDARFGMAHIYGPNRADLMYAAGYATAEERLFLMDAVRRTAKGTLAGLTGASAASGDADQLTDQDFSDAELDKQFNDLPKHFGASGRHAQSDILNYIAGINARIDEVNKNPTELPAEYAALGTTPQRWTVSDTAAEAVFLVTQFTVSNGGEEVNSQMQEAFQRRFGKGWRKPYHDLREAQDPEAFTVAKRPFHSDNPGRVRHGLNAMPDYGSIAKRDALVSGPSSSQAAAQRAALPAWARSVEGLRASLPHVESNAVMIPRRLSSDGRALAAMGPQVGYYSPQIFSEYELHGGGIDAEGVTFPGASPWPLIGHGIDFAWSGTSANGDNEDTFVERLCNPNGSRPSRSSTHYRYRGRCIQFRMRDQTVTTPYSVLNPTSPPEKITYRTMRSVHGPVFAFARVHGAPVALSKAKAVDFHELSAALPFMHLAENQATSARSFQRIFSPFPGTENWFYVDRRDVAFIQSGVYPRHVRGTDVDRPFWGDGRADWQGFNPTAYTFRSIPASHRPQALNPVRDHGLIISWNNKEAPGWRKGPTEWSNGPVHHAMILQRHVLREVHAHGGRINLTGLTRAVNETATTDLRGEDVYPLMRRVIEHGHGESERLLRILDAWHRSGSNRLDANGDNVYDHSAAVALMDAWWPRFVRAEFQPGLGVALFGKVESNILSLSSDFGWDWGSQVQKDLRNALGLHERGRYSRVYCGGPVAEPVRGPRLLHVRRSCRSVLLSTLRAAIADVKRRLGPNPSQWKVYATCKDSSTCDEIVPNTAGAVDTPAFPWQNRGTYHQIDEITGHR